MTLGAVFFIEEEGIPILGIWSKNMDLRRNSPKIPQVFLTRAYGARGILDIHFGRGRAIKTSVREPIRLAQYMNFRINLVF